MANLTLQDVLDRTAEAYCNQDKEQEEKEDDILMKIELSDLPSIKPPVDSDYKVDFRPEAIACDFSFEQGFSSSTANMYLDQRQCVLIHEDLVVAVGIAGKNQSPLTGKECGWVVGLEVHAQYQGRGLSKIILYAILERLQCLGYSDAYLLVSTKNLVAISLYISHGFEAILEDAYEAERWERLSERRKTMLTLRERRTSFEFRMNALVQEPSLLLAEASRYFAVCGLAAIVYCSALLSPAEFVRRTSSLVDNPKDLWQASFIFFQKKRAALERAGVLRWTPMVSAPTFTLETLQSENGHHTQTATPAAPSLRGAETTAAEAVDVNATLNSAQAAAMKLRESFIDMGLCWHVARQLRLDKAHLYNEQLTFSATFAPRLSRVAFSTDSGDLCLTPEALCAAIHSRNGFAPLRSLATEQFPSSGDNAGARFASLFSRCEHAKGALVLGKRRDGASEEEASTEASPAGDLDHWFVLANPTLTRPQSDGALGEGFVLGGDAWNYVGNAGGSTRVEEPPSVWVRDLGVCCAVYVTADS